MTCPVCHDSGVVDSGPHPIGIGSEPCYNCDPEEGRCLGGCGELINNAEPEYCLACQAAALGI